jgi:hypothetical protein
MASATFTDHALPTGGTLREALRVQALHNLYDQSPGTIEHAVNEAIEHLEKEHPND